MRAQRASYLIATLPVQNKIVWLANFFVTTAVSSLTVLGVRLSQKLCFALNFAQPHDFKLYTI